MNDLYFTVKNKKGLQGRCYPYKPYKFNACISALHNWFRYIINSYKHKFTNGFTEGMNNNIKVLKRIAYGYRDFNNFRNRILLCFG